MNKFLRPQLPIPPQIIVSEEGSFAYFTFTHRVPAIIERVIAENNFAPPVVEKLQALAQDLLHGAVRPLENDGGAELEAWAKYIVPYQSRRWLDTPFYFAETYFYRRLLEATQYFSSEVKEQRVDPFELQKRLSLETVMESVRIKVRQYQNFSSFGQYRDDNWKQALLNLLYLNLWGNRADLSLNPTKAGEFKHESIETQSQEKYILLNDASIVIDYLSSFKKTRIDFIADNAGFELISDLFIIDFLLASKAAEVVYLHLKAHPTFVSDAMVKDVHSTLKFLANVREKDVSELAIRLQNHVTSGRLKLLDNLFWTTPLFFWEMPNQLRQELAQSSLVFIKGDANYRRLIGDCHWSKTSSFYDISCYFPAAFTVLRTLKSELIVGLQQSQIEKLNSEDSQWLTNGQRGIIQFVESPLSSQIGKTIY